MKKKARSAIMGTVAALMIASAVVSAAQAAPATGRRRDPSPLEGTFSGIVYGDSKSRAPITLSLEEDGDEVTGTAHLGKGLVVDAGRCGKAYIPAVTETATVEVSRRNPREFSISPTFKISGVKVTVDLEGELSEDGDTIYADAEIDLPWICGRDPSLVAVLNRETGRTR
jgi:hypothetical protein